MLDVRPSQGNVIGGDTGVDSPKRVLGGGIEVGDRVGM